ncbi:MAG: HAMP domain-containing histidine kinase [Lachnospiraceae bacterium]|jgi:signal transduction histidine kinase|nr:HAMP domain-containing histidine kinase [Lachnospiraceae bacterium]
MVIIVILAILLAISITYIILLNIDMNKIYRELLWIKQQDTNKKITSSTLNKNIKNLMNEINNVLEEERQIQIKSNNINNELKQIITNISHDLKTPLTSAMGYIQLINESDVSNDKKEEYLKIIETRLRVLSKLLEDFFDFTKIMEHNVETNIEKINLSNLLNESIASYYEDFQNKNIVPSINIVPNIFVHSDEKILRRIFQNIIQNVLTHGKDSLEISLNKADKIEIIFKNKFDNENIEQDKLFSRFYTSDISRTNKNTGLGLAIVKELSEEININVDANIEKNYLSICILM